jgi:hypothetical protein
MSSLSYPVLTTITNYLDIINSKKLSKSAFNDDHLSQFCDPKVNFCPKFTNKLTSLGVTNPHKFMDVIKDSNSVISGSMILQILLDEEWDGSDIDIYTISYEKLIDELLRIEPIDKALINNDIPIGYLTEEELVIRDQCRAIKNKASSFYKYENKNPIKLGKISTFNYSDKLKIQIIEIQDENILDFSEYMNKYVCRTYDFDFCKNMYDGFNVFIHDRKSILNKTCDLKNIQLPTCRLERIIKYNKRGFTINSVNEYYTRFLTCESLNKRIDNGEYADEEVKYIRRDRRMAHILYYLRNIFKALNLDDYDKTNGMSSYEYISLNLFVDKYNKSKLESKFKDKIALFIHVIISNMDKIDNFEKDFMELQDNIIKNLYETDYLKDIIEDWTMLMLSRLDMTKLYTYDGASLQINLYKNL